MVSPEHDDLLPGRPRGRSPFHLALGLFGVVALAWAGVFLLLRDGHEGPDEAPAATAGPPLVVEDGIRDIPAEDMETAMGTGPADAPAQPDDAGAEGTLRWELPPLADSATLAAWARLEDRWEARARRLDGIVHHARTESRRVYHAGAEARGVHRGHAAEGHGIEGLSTEGHADARYVNDGPVNQGLVNGGAPSAPSGGEARLAAELAEAVPAMARGPQPSADGPMGASPGHVVNYTLGDGSARPAHHIARDPTDDGAVGPMADPSLAPRLAIVIDDWGYPWQEAERFLQLPVPLTVAVIPHLPLSRQHARQAAAYGHEVILHLPMEPLADSVPLEPDTLRVGMSPVEILSIVDRALRSLPEARGINNHMGSKATAEPAVMHPLLADVARRGLFFLDSYTSPRSVVSQVAAAHGVPVAVNRVFLDHHADEEFVVAQLYKAMDVARREGEAVAIGHVRPGTYKALVRVLPELEASGIRLVYASELIRRLPPPAGPMARRTERLLRTAALGAALGREMGDGT